MCAQDNICLLIVEGYDAVVLEKDRKSSGETKWWRHYGKELLHDEGDNDDEDNDDGGDDNVDIHFFHQFDALFLEPNTDLISIVGFLTQHRSRIHWRVHWFLESDPGHNPLLVSRTCHRPHGHCWFFWTRHKPHIHCWVFESNTGHMSIVVSRNRDKNNAHCWFHECDKGLIAIFFWTRHKPRVHCWFFESNTGLVSTVGFRNRDMNNFHCWFLETVTGIISIVGISNPTQASRPLSFVGFSNSWHFSSPLLVSGIRHRPHV